MIFKKLLLIFNINKLNLMIMIRKLLFITSLAFGLTNAQTTIISQEFEDITTLTDWTFLNKSQSPSTGNWFQGNPVVFLGNADTEYIAANYALNTGSSVLSAWMITPNVTLKNGDVIKFFTRTTDLGATVYPDRLELRMSTGATFTAPAGTGAAGASSVGSFTTLLLSVNPTLTSTGYPHTWTEYSYTVSGLSGDIAANLAFRYYVTGGGTTGSNSDYIGVDTFSVTRPVMAVSDVSKASMSVYPNPTADYLTFSQKVTSADVYDLSGKLVASPAVVDSKIDVKSLQNGNYVVKVNTEAGSTTHKFIKK
ncbi:choice-of-anchor J domain-containing protein [Epilithonimonas ginsengisoli]|uniref:Choice-of-anchor J domain-containing protein n=1 Tax=Epilithonimonas ginsengisoli TaxID=1245592 RepID=A0ABU4JIH9_9FLAO|nr:MULTISPECIES: choice-of-anchor J domain-containing protein [Chryseobacterium group]MBV6878868.1 T9SS type A sorting domain-containing protein [Epilithonimonas sp. FP105]MDW8549472.1 choice-of-anchor J domain-containing protein [Epilithonimonas ginsengisoli]